MTALRPPFALKATNLVRTVGDRAGPRYASPERSDPRRTAPGEPDATTNWKNAGDPLGRRRGARMRRREFIAAVGGAVVSPLAVKAEQPERMRRVGVLLLWPENDPMARASVSAFAQA
jgi:hypothetical protein